MRLYAISLANNVLQARQNSIKLPDRKLNTPTGLPPSTISTLLHHKHAVAQSAKPQPFGQQAPMEQKAHPRAEPSDSFIAQVQQTSAHTAAVVGKSEELSRNEDHSSIRVPGMVPDQETLEGQNRRGVLGTGTALAMTQAATVEMCNLSSQ